MNNQIRWGRFVSTLAQHEQETIIRSNAGANLADRMPTQSIIEDLQFQCLDLTTTIYGNGNCSALYAWFLRLCEIAGITAYKYAQLPVLNSDDGYLSAFNKEFRNQFMQKTANPFTVERFQVSRYLPFIWQRKFDLQCMDDNHALVTLRNFATTELSKFCANAYPYQPSHGLGIAEYSDNSVCDMEKVAREAEFLNPFTNKNLLAGEQRFAVGQNSHTGSSIPGVLHSHHFNAEFTQFKLYGTMNKPVKISSFNGIVDIIQVGAKLDAFFIKLQTNSVVEPEYLNFCIGLRLCLEREFGLKAVDLFFHIIPTLDGNFVTIMAPFAKLNLQLTSNGLRCFINPETGENNLQLQVAEHLHLDNAAKKWGVNFSDQAMLSLCIKNGKQRLQALYDFTSKKGTRDIVQEYVLGK